MVANANFKNTPLSYLSFIIDFNFNDMSGDYYRKVGSTIYKTMCIKSILPWIKLAIISFVKCTKRIKDSGCCSKTLLIPNTKSRTPEHFIDSRVGPEVKLDLQYSFILMMIFTTFVHGMALPLLFPITAFAMINVYASEKILFAYIYRKPKLYGINLNNSTIEIMTWCPYLSLCFTYWMIGNRQIFFNETHEITNSNDI